MRIDYEDALMEIQKAKAELIAKNRTAAEYWLNNCPKSYRTKKSEKLVKSFLTSEIRSAERSGRGEWALGLFGGQPGNWTPYAYHAVELYRVDVDAFDAREEMINSRRHACQHCTTYADAGCIRIIVDGAEVLYPTPEGDGTWKAFYVPDAGDKSTEERYLTLYNKREIYLGGFRAKHATVTTYDCGEDYDGMELYHGEEQAIFGVYSTTNGIKIERWS